MKKRTKKTKAHSYRDIRRKFVKVSAIPPEMILALYGPAGTGKTTFSASFPKPLLLIDCSEKGTDSIRDVKGVTVLRAEDWQDVDDIYWYLKKEDHGFKTVVMDTISQSQDMCVRQVLEDKGKDLESGALGNWGTMTKGDWGAVATKMKTFIISMRDLPLDALIFVAHDRVFNAGGDEEDENAIAPHVGPRLSPSVADTLNAAVSIIAQTHISETYTRKKKKGEKKSKPVRKVEYCLRIGPHATFITKIRKPKSIVLPDVLVNANYKSLLSYVAKK